MMEHGGRLPNNRRRQRLRLTLFTKRDRFKRSAQRGRTVQLDCRLFGLGELGECGSPQRARDPCLGNALSRALQCCKRLAIECLRQRVAW